ncbi:hypothetical protein evm_006362 [Chilo suppressalis]|nr:hypothetical protein evm_006362 [Chilo suppressalis]
MNRDRTWSNKSKPILRLLIKGVRDQDVVMGLRWTSVYSSFEESLLIKAFFTCDINFVRWEAQLNLVLAPIPNISHLPTYKGINFLWFRIPARLSVNMGLYSLITGYYCAYGVFPATGDKGLSFPRAGRRGPATQLNENRGPRSPAPSEAATQYPASRAVDATRRQIAHPQPSRSLQTISVARKQRGARNEFECSRVFRRVYVRVGLPPLAGGVRRSSK